MGKRESQVNFSLQELSAFFTSPLATRAAAPLSESASIELQIDGVPYCFSRRAKGNIFRSGAPQQADIVFWIPAGAMQKILRAANREDIGIGKLGLQIFDLILSPNPQLKIKFRVQAGFFAILQKGYWGVLLAGGPEILEFLRRQGLGSIAKIRSLLAAWKKG